MAALVEIKSVNQVPGEPRCRWFTSEDLDLVVWSDEMGRSAAFQLCYDKGASERALTWRADGGFIHMQVDDGERVGGRPKSTPILLREVHPLPANRVSNLFAQASGDVPAEVAEFIQAKLREHPDFISPREADA